MSERQREVLLSKEMLCLVEGQAESLKSPESAWQPADYLPDFSKKNWEDEVREIQKNCKDVSDAVFMVLVGNTITEEALPSYMNWLNQHDYIADHSGADDHAWAKWTRAWTAEENKHGDLLNKYLHFTGRVDMRSVDVTINNLMKNGFNTNTENNAYMGMAFTSFQERGTRISHSRTGMLASQTGDDILRKICNVIAVDEGKHEVVYQAIISKVFEMDPDQMVQDFKKVMEVGIVMPASRMGEPNMFKYFSAVAEREGIYTSQDYTEILKFLLNKWKVSSLTGLSPEGAKAQDYLCRLPERYERLASRKKKSTKELSSDYFWIHQDNTSQLNQPSFDRSAELGSL